jgi:hypothetical protein
MITIPMTTWTQALRGPIHMRLNEALRIIPRNCPPTPTGIVSRDSSGDKRHLHVSCLTPRLGGSASRWILADLHRATNIVPYQYPVLVSSREAHCLRGQHGRHQRKTPEDLGGARPFGVGQSRSLLSKTL